MTRKYNISDAERMKRRIEAYSRIEKGLIGGKFGKLGGRPKIEPGYKHHHLTVLSFAGKNIEPPNRSLWNCICDCGNEIIMDSGKLRKPFTTSCGCVRQKLARQKGKAQRTEEGYLLNKYTNLKGGAKARNIFFDLEYVTFRRLVQQNCFYCNAEPVKVEKSHVGIPVPVNGIDRYDNSKGYTLENAATCCRYCNTIKLDRTHEEMLEHINKILNNFQLYRRH